MNNENKIIVPDPTPEATLPSEVELPSDSVTTINIDEIKPNTVIVIKVQAETPMHKMAVAPLFSKLLSPYADKLKSKGVVLMLMTDKESIDLVTENEMNHFGWFKKEKSSIVLPFQK